MLREKLFLDIVCQHATHVILQHVVSLLLSHNNIMLFYFSAITKRLWGKKL